MIRHRRTRPDRGTILVATLVVVALAGVACSSLLLLTDVGIRSQRAIHRRQSVRAATESALTFTEALARRALGADPSSCPHIPERMATTSLDIVCSGSSLQSAPPALTTTLHGSLVDSIVFPTWTLGLEPSTKGTIVVNTGTLESPGVSFLADRVRLSDPNVVRAWTPAAVDWTRYAATSDGNAADPYPYLAPLPRFERPGAQASVGSCTVFFPGRYLGSSSLTLSGGTHYFTSGIYYFERTLVISAGARVVMGSGDTPGCTSDDIAANSAKAPRRHDITGSGATVVLGAGARLVVQESSLVINRRSGSGAGFALRTVHFGTSTSTVRIPTDVVLADSGAAVPVNAYSVVAPGSATPLSYSTSTLSPTTTFALDIRLNGSDPESNRVQIPGRIFLPGSGVKAVSTTSTYSLSLSGGITTARVSLSFPYAPSGPGTTFLIDCSMTRTPPTHIVVTATASLDDIEEIHSLDFDVQGSQWALIGTRRRLNRVHTQ